MNTQNRKQFTIEQRLELLETNITRLITEHNEFERRVSEYLGIDLTTKNIARRTETSKGTKIEFDDGSIVEINYGGTE